MIKKLLIATTLLIYTAAAYSQKGYKFTFNVEGVQDTVIYLAGYYGAKQYYKDTTKVDKNGNFVFEGEEPFPGGIYSIVMPDQKTYFEFNITEPKFTMTTKRNDLVMSMSVKGSEENKVFYDYLQFINGQQKKAAPLRKKLKNKQEEKEENQKSKKLDEEIKKVKEELSAIDTEVKKYKIDMIAANGDKLVGKIFSTSQDPEVPDAPKGEDGKPLDKDFSYKYYKAHYLDGVDFCDERLLRSPVFHNKLDYYIKKLTIQIPDSINKEADMLLEKAKCKKEMFKYVTHYITNSYEKSKIMCMDRVFVHMAQEVYCKDLAWWVDSAQKAKICNRAETLAPLMCGEVAPNIILQDTSEEKWINMHEIEAEYTILFFWDPGCGHCKKAMPKFKAMYDKFKGKGVELYSPCTEFETKDWKKFVTEKELNWINVSDNPEINKNAAKYIHLTTLESLNYRDTYDIFSTPQVYLLDKDKKILAKKLSAEQLDDILSDKLDMPRTIREEKDEKKDAKDSHGEDSKKKDKPKKVKKS
ncbi:MAG: DUF5106 domain-containing protein [Flavobacteriales bacterium]|nr:DUF5106 domain-containing protein [Flavobacteriales bacterium]